MAFYVMEDYPDNGPKRVWRRRLPGTPTILDRRLEDHHHIELKLNGPVKNIVKKLFGSAIHGKTVSVCSVTQTRYILGDSASRLGLPCWYQPTELIHHRKENSIVKTVNDANVGEPAEAEPDEITSDDGLHWQPL